MLRGFLRVAVAALLAPFLLGATCGTSALSILPGVVNDPRNLSLRRALLAYGTSRLCTEVQKRSVPLRLRDEDPVVGRFRATSCFAQELANGNLFIQFAGSGWVWTNLTKRLAFEAGGAVEYETDFLLDGGTMYLYFRQRATSAATFRTGLVEEPAAAAVAGFPLAPSNEQANALGASIMKSEIARGFTVLRDPDGSVQFGLGVVERGTRPKAPYERRSDDRVLLANERTEVHQNQRDYAGPFEVTHEGEALLLTVAVEGAQGIDTIVVPRATGEAWLHQYVHQIALTPPPGPAALDEVVYAGPVWRRAVRVPPGEYYVVFDNTAAAGRLAPPATPGDDRAALVSFAVELGDPP